MTQRFNLHGIQTQDLRALIERLIRWNSNAPPAIADAKMTRLT